jgi:ATP-dependent RNA helicase RhlE
LSFTEFGLSQEIIDGILDMGFTQPTPIQLQAIPLVLEGRDIVASAQTGTGKTAAFVVPILEKIKNSPNKGIQCLILSPTRELAQQIDEQIFAIGYHVDIPSVTIYGGGDWGEQQKALERGVRIIVATPGRLLDLMKVRNLDFSNIEILVLDEADRMLDMGFIPDVRTIINRVPKKRQTLFFSATIHDKLKPLLDEFLIDPFRISIAPNTTAANVNQWLYFVDFDKKADLVKYLMQDEQFPSCILFTGTKRGADELARELRRKRLAVTSIHGDRTQQEREEALAAFKQGNIRVLVATDVLARGIDIEEVSLVINYDVPRELEDYIHRIGRTARADAKGDAITFVSHQDKRYLDPIRKAMGDKLVVLNVPDFLAGRPEDQQVERPSHSQDRGPRRDTRRPQAPDRAATNELPVARIERAAKVDKVDKVADVVADEAVAETEKPAPRRQNQRRRPDKESADKDQSTAAEPMEIDAKPVAAKPARPRPVKKEDEVSTGPSVAESSTAESGETSDVKPARRRRRGGRNRRGRSADTEGRTGERPANPPREQREPREPREVREPQAPREARPDQRRPNLPREDRTDQRKPNPPREQREPREPRGPQAPRSDKPRDGQRGPRDNRQGGNRHRDPRYDRPTNYGVTQKLPVTNDLSSMSTSLKDGKSAAKPKAEEQKSGVFGFIKKIFGKE